MREWLTEEETRTVAGRAALALKRRAAQWEGERRVRFLPNPGEYRRILLFAPRRHWTNVHRAMVRVASACGIRWGLERVAVALPRRS